MKGNLRDHTIFAVMSYHGVEFVEEDQVPTGTELIDQSQAKVTFKTFNIYRARRRAGKFCKANSWNCMILYRERVKRAPIYLRVFGVKEIALVTGRPVAIQDTGK